MIPKNKPYRNRRLLNLAHRVTECQFNLPGCVGYQAHGCEPAHSNFQIHGHGMGVKASDDEHVASCHNCHVYFDSHKLPRDFALQKYTEARKRTFTLYKKEGWLEMVGYQMKEAA